MTGADTCVRTQPRVSCCANQRRRPNAHKVQVAHLSGTVPGMTPPPYPPSAAPPPVPRAATPRTPSVTRERLPRILAGVAAVVMLLCIVGGTIVAATLITAVMRMQSP